MKAINIKERTKAKHAVYNISVGYLLNTNVAKIHTEYDSKAMLLNTVQF